MNRRTFVKTAGSGTLAVGFAGCIGSGESGDGGNGGGSNSKWGLPSCGDADRSIKVRGATVVDSQYDGARSSYRTKVRVVMEVLGANKQVVRIKSFNILDENGSQVGEITKYEASDNLELEPAATKSFEFIARTSEEAAEIDNIVVQAMPVDDWEAASLSEWQNSENKGCS